MYRAGGTTSALPRPIPEAKPDRLLLGGPAGKRRDSAEDEARGSRPAGDWLEGRIVYACLGAHAWCAARTRSSCCEGAFSRRS